MRADRSPPSTASAGRTGRATSASRADEGERALLWKGRKSAFGAIARVAPDYYLHDAVVPRTPPGRRAPPDRRRLRDEEQITVMNVFHAGDGNLHPLHGVRRPRAWASGIGSRPSATRSCGRASTRAACSRASTASGSRSATLMPLDLRGPTTSMRRRACGDAFDPTGLANPEKVLPRGSRCGELAGCAGCRRARGSDRRGSRRSAATVAAAAVGRSDGRGHAPRGGRAAAAATRPRRAHRRGSSRTTRPTSRSCVGAGTRSPRSMPSWMRPVRSARSTRATPAPPSAGSSRRGLSGSRRLRLGPLRDQVLEVRFATADGRLVRAAVRRSRT